MPFFLFFPWEVWVWGREHLLSCSLRELIGFLSLSVEGWSLFPEWQTTRATLSNFRCSEFLYYGLLHPQTSGRGGGVCVHVLTCACVRMQGNVGNFPQSPLCYLWKRGVLLSLEVNDSGRLAGWQLGYPSVFSFPALP